MGKSRNFTVFLLKESFTEENSLKEQHGLELIKPEEADLPQGAVMYVADTPSKEPWWKNYWQVNKNLYQALKGALVFLPVKERWVVLSFGMAYHKLKDECYEYDFGLRTTLNVLNPQKIKSTDILQPENAKRQRVQSPTTSEITFFDLTNDDTILKKMTGAVKDEYIDLFKNITGGNSLKISSNLQSNEIVQLCEDLIEIYKKEDYKESFPGLQSIVPISDPEIKAKLNNKLLEAFNAERAPVELVLAIPEMFDYSTDYKIKYSGVGRTNKEFLEVYIYDYRSYLEEKKVTVDSVETFKSHKLRIVNDDNDKMQEYTIYKSFLFDCEIEDKAYHLCEGEWYYIESDFVEKLSKQLDSFFVNEHKYLHDCENRREDDYNKSVSDKYKSNLICLDKKSISPKGQYSLEPCDLIFINEVYLELAHIKISTRSSSLSHLFNQGVNSIELLRSNSEAQSKLKILTNENEDMHTYIDNGTYSVLYGIITNNDKDKKSKSLPFFSRISLLRATNALKMMNVPVKVYYIKDNYDRKNYNKTDAS